MYGSRGLYGSHITRQLICTVSKADGSDGDDRDGSDGDDDGVDDDGDEQWRRLK